MNKLVRPTVQEDVEFVARHMRMEDVAECLAACVIPYYALQYGYENSTPCLTVIDPKTGNPGCILGAMPKDDEGFSKVWLLGTPAIERNSIAFLRNSKPVMEELWGDSVALYNYTHAGNIVHHRWLRWLGFTFIRLVELQPNQFFYEFVKLREY